MAEISKQALIVENNTSFPNNNNGQITPSVLRAFNYDMIDSTVNQIVFNNYSSSVTESLQALSVFTASVAGTNAFTASIAGTNAFTQSANNRITALESWSSSLDVSYASQAEFDSYTSSNDAKVNSLIAFTSSVITFSALDALNASSASVSQYTSSMNSYTASNDAKVNSLIAFTSSVLSISALDPLNQASASLQAFTASVAGTNAFTASQLLLNGTFATTGSNVFVGTNTFTVGNTTFTTNTFFENTAAIQNYSGSSITFGLSATTGSNYTLKSNPFEPVLLITRESDNAKPIQMDWRDNKVTLAESGAVEIAPSAFGGFKVNTTSSFYGNAVWLIAEGFTSSLAYISSSVSGSDSNLIFKNNGGVTPTVVSGSSNIFQSPAVPSATFGRYVGGSHNIYITSASVPQLTGSAGISPTMNANIINGNGTIFLRTPVSSSAYNISNNIINGNNISFGSAAATSFVSASAGLSFTNNFSNATVTAVANKTTLVTTNNINLNNLGGSLILNMDSSSIAFASNTLQGSLIVNNSYSGSTASTNFLAVNSNIFVGSNHSLVASGSNTTLSVPRQATNSMFLGSAHSASVNLLGDNSNLNAVALIGHGLSVTGSSALQTALPTGADRGTVIVGRFNKDVQSNNTVFVVGAGTSGSVGITRRNAFLIDSGSNTFVEGTFNVSGSSTLNGNTTITGSLTLSSSAAIELNVIGNSVLTGSVYGNVVPLTIVSSTASMDCSLGNFFTLTLANSVNTHLAATNIRPGQTINLLITQGNPSGSISYNSTFDWPSGNAYTASIDSSTKDIVTFISFDDTTLYGAAVKNLV